MSVINLGEAAKILGIKPQKLDYLCKKGKIYFETTESGRKRFDSTKLTIADKTSTNTSKKANHPKCPAGFITVKEAAVLMGVTAQTVYRYIREGRMPYTHRPQNSRSVYLMTDGLEVTGKVKAKNVPPTISQPEVISEDFQNVENESHVVDRVFVTLKQFMSSVVDQCTEGNEEAVINYVKNMLMYRIQNLAIAL